MGMTTVAYFPWKSVEHYCRVIARQAAPETSRILAIGRGGVIPGTILSHMMDIPVEYLTLQAYESTKRRAEGIEKYWTIPDAVAERCNTRQCLVIDDICDTGALMQYMHDVVPKAQKAVLVTKQPELGVEYFAAHRVPPNYWIVFPWEPEFDSTSVPE